MADQDLTTYIALFHHRDHAEAALRDLANAGFGAGAVQVIRGSDIAGRDDANHNIGNAYDDGTRSTLSDLGVPEEDRKYLQDGLDEGGTVLSFRAPGSRANEIESILQIHSTKKIDEKDVTDDRYPASAALASTVGTAAGETVIPVVEEQLAVGKREVDRGGVRVYKRVVEEPASAAVTLREEHVVVNRQPVNRPVTESDLRGGDRTIELTETAEEAVVGKTARVVEEIRVGKEATERTETVRDTVRRTEVDVEQVDEPASRQGKTRY